MDKVMRIGTTKGVGNGGRWASIFIHAKIGNNRLSISGVIGPLPGGNALGGCGQIDMEFAHRNENDNNSISTLIKPNEIRFAKGWNEEKWFALLDVWKNWHLNDMNAECEHQKLLGWKYKDHHNPKTYEGEECPICGYRIGHSWLKKEIPQYVIDFLNWLPETDKTPAWV